MSNSWQVRVYEKQNLVYVVDGAGPVELGRQCDASESIYSKNERSGYCRLVIAPWDETDISRQHVLLETIGDQRMRVTNRSDRQTLRLPTELLQPKAMAEAEFPVVLTLGNKGNKVVRVMAVDTSMPSLRSLPTATIPPGSQVSRAVPLVSLARGKDKRVDFEAISDWLKTVVEVLQSAASSSSFFEKAADAVVTLVGLDAGKVLLWQDGNWEAVATRNSALAPADADWKPSEYVLNRVRQDKRTFWEELARELPVAESLRKISVVVAAPILDPRGEVIGALYGHRGQKDTPFVAPISEIEAFFVELLACGVAAGLYRMECERAVLTSRVQFEQFFTPELARELEAHPDLLQGRDRDVSTLFCDIRGFSRISKRLGPTATMEWIGGVMGVLSECVLAERGVLVDYIGDELLAMWGAPETQLDHAVRACRAALGMVKQLPSLNARWQERLGEPLAIGIGINSGPARVGNMGTQRKFKYGPLGDSVNIASRVQGANKYLQTTLLITGSVHSQLPPDFNACRLCKAKVVNIAEPVELYELVEGNRPDWPYLKGSYEEALAKFERRELRPAARILGRLVTEHPQHGPSLVLLSRVVNEMVAPDPGEFDVTWELPGK
jgi:adenylate cyclase